MIDTIQLWMVFELILSLAVWPFLVGVFLIAGSRPSREGQATVGRLYRTAIVAATLAALPMLIWLVVLLPPYSVETSFPLALSATAVSAVWTGRYLRRLMRGPYSAQPADGEVPETGRLDQRLERFGQRLPVVRRLVAENGAILPGWLMGDSLRFNVYSNYEDFEEMEKSRFPRPQLVIPYAPGECWWQMAVVPMAAVSASCAAAFVGESMAIGVALVVFAVAKCLVNWVFRRGRGETAEHYFA